MNAADLDQLVAYVFDYEERLSGGHSMPARGGRFNDDLTAFVNRIREARSARPVVQWEKCSKCDKPTCERVDGRPECPDHSMRPVEISGEGFPDRFAKAVNRLSEPGACGPCLSRAHDHCRGCDCEVCKAARPDESAPHATCGAMDCPECRIQWASEENPEGRPLPAGYCEHGYMQRSCDKCQDKPVMVIEREGE